MFKLFQFTLILSLLLSFWSTATAEEQGLNASPPSQFDYGNVKQQLEEEVTTQTAVTDNFTNEFLKEQVTSERWYIVLLCVVSLISLIVVLFFIRSSQDYSARDVVNASGLNLIIFGTIILVLIVDTHEQLTAAIGVLGAIAGYLFGTLQRRSERQEGTS
ncbi:MAG: hypothetical protein QNJ69_10750 [Gammaproteobacteria bacterium]|nr:hypothetical protein [Gammaproteobacteria bacterium]